MSQVRVRFAPSPTGSLHVGGARTALYNMLFARANGGKFIIRIEDTDQARSTDAAMNEQLADLKWLGINWDEGPFRQSERLEIYQEIADDFLAKGLAYYCFLTDAEIEKYREQKQPWNSPYRDLSREDAAAKLANGESATIRFRAPDVTTKYEFVDMVRGKISLTSDMIGDFVIIRSDGMPVYNFCCAIDDHAMKITHVFRGEEHLSNTLRQLMIYQALSANPPEFGHLSIILGADKKKLSKRQGAVSCDSFRQNGYLPQALLNYIALLGWSPKTEQEIFSLQELSQIFKAEQLNAAAPIFDQKKLDWLNAQHLRALSAPELFKYLEAFMPEQSLPEDANWRQNMFELLASDAILISDFASAIKVYLDDFIWQAPADFSEVLSWPQTRAIWQDWHAWLESTDIINAVGIAEFMQSTQAKLGVKGKQLFMPLRLAVVAKCHGVDVKMAAPLITRQSLIARVQACLEQA